MDSLLVAYFDINDTQFNSHQTRTHKNTTRSIQETKRFNLEVPDGLITPVALSFPSYGNQELIFHQILCTSTAVISMSPSTSVHRDGNSGDELLRTLTFLTYFLLLHVYYVKEQCIEGQPIRKKGVSKFVRAQTAYLGQIRLNLKWEICKTTVVTSKNKYVELEISIINQLEQPVSVTRD